MFLVYDNTQSVYGQAHRRKRGWTWKNLGIEVTGRSQIFDVNYRNSPEILELAWKFIKPALDKASMITDTRENSGGEIHKIIEPRKLPSRSSGVSPTLLQINYSEMPSEIAKQVKMALETYPESSIGILTHPDCKYKRQKISRELHQLGIENHAPNTSQERNGNVVDRPYTIIDSWNALKGVEFDAVIIAGVDDLVVEQNDKDKDFEEKAGLYVAMTRAKDHLIMLYHDKTPIVEMIEDLLSSAPVLSES